MRRCSTGWRSGSTTRWRPNSLINTSMVSWIFLLWDLQCEALGGCYGAEQSGRQWRPWVDRELTISSLPCEWWAAQRGYGSPIPRGVQGQVGWGPGQTGLVLNVEVGGPACSRRAGAWWFLRSLPTQAIGLEGTSRYWDFPWNELIPPAYSPNPTERIPNYSPNPRSGGSENFRNQLQNLHYQF